MDVVAGGVRLEGDARRLPATPEILERRFEIDAVDVGEGGEHAEAAFENRCGSGPAVRSEARRHQACLRRGPRVHGLGLRAVREVLEDAARQTAGDAERLHGLQPTEAAQLRRRDGCAEHTADGSGMESTPVEDCRRRHADAGDDLVAGDQRHEELGAARAVGLGRR